LHELRGRLDGFLENRENGSEPVRDRFGSIFMNSLVRNSEIGKQLTFFIHSFTRLIGLVHGLLVCMELVLVYSIYVPRTSGLGHWGKCEFVIVRMSE
jgi:hypothetical protein